MGGASNAGATGGALSSLQHPRQDLGARSRNAAVLRAAGDDVEEEDASEAASDSMAMPPPGLERGPGVGQTRPPSFQSVLRSIS